MRFEEEVVGEEPPQDVLGQLDPVDASDHRAVADARLERLQRLGTLGGRGHRPDVVRVGGERRHERLRLETGERACGRREVVGPALRVEPARAVGSHAGEQLLRRLGGQGAEPQRGRERRVAEVHAPEVWTPVTQVSGHQAQVVVLDQHGRALRRHVGHGIGEDLVQPPVGVPGGRPATVERGLASEVPQAVVGEPEHLVAHHVVGEPVGLGVDGEQAHAEAVRLDEPGGRRGSVPVGHGGGQPGHVGARDQRADAGHEPARAPLGDERAVVRGLEGDRAAVGDEDDRPVGRGGAHRRPR